jgi:hypothetical protein
VPERLSHALRLAALTVNATLDVRLFGQKSGQK